MVSEEVNEPYIVTVLIGDATNGAKGNYTLPEFVATSLNISLYREKNAASGSYQLFDVYLDTNLIIRLSLPLIETGDHRDLFIPLNDLLIRAGTLYYVNVSGTTTGDAKGGFTLVGYKKKEKIIL